MVCTRCLVRYRISLFFLGLALTAASCSEKTDVPEAERVAWLADHAIPLHSIDPADENYSDLEPFRRMIGRSRVVMLGEQSHGDGATFHAKTRLIKYLHQECGFDVLAIESGLYDCAKAWQQIQQGVPGEQAVESSVFSIWTRSREFHPLAEYVARAAQSSHPLELAGFDCQFTSTNSDSFFLNDLRSCLHDAGIDTSAIDGWQKFQQVIRGLLSGQYRQEAPDTPEEEQFFATLEQIQLHLPHTGLRKNRLWHQLLKSLKAEAEGTFHMAHVGMTNMTLMDSQYRDLQMGDNIIWLSREYYPGRKIIVWAASRHNAYKLQNVDTRHEGFSYEGFVNMGDVVQEGLGRRVYNLGFTAYEGTAGPWLREAFTLSEPESGSLENLFHQADLETAILDFRRRARGDRWLDTQIVARPFGYGEMSAVWPEIFDGICFTRVMTPSTRR